MPNLVLMMWLIIIVPALGYGQERPAANTFDLAAGAVQFDLAGTGTAPGLAVRGTRAITDALGINLGMLAAWPRETAGRSTLFVPEVHLHYHWRVGRVRPYAGGGVGAAIVAREGDTQAHLSLAVTGGARVRLWNRMALLGEFRLRGVEHDFAGTTAEWLGGLSWTFDSPAFD